MFNFIPSIDRYIFRLVIVPMLGVFALAASLLLLDKMLRLFDFVAIEGGPIGVVFKMLGALIPEYASLAIPLGLLLGVLLAFRKLATTSELDTMLIMRTLNATHRVLTNEAAKKCAELEEKKSDWAEILRVVSGEKAKTMYDTGDINAGIQASFKDENYVRPLNTNFYQLKPLNMPPSWFNDGKGGTPEPLEGASNNGMSNYFPKFSPDGKWIVFCRAKSFMLLQPDSALYIIPAEGGEARRLACNTRRMNSWHSWSPNSKRLASKECRE